MNDKQLEAIDALVAECVMGYHEDKAVPGGLQPGPWFRNRDGSVFFTTNPKAPTSAHRYWSPTSSWSAAGEVVEKMRKKTSVGYYEWELRSEGDSRNGTWKANAGVWAEASSNSLPLAICLAALRAVGAGDKLDAILKATT